MRLAGNIFHLLTGGFVLSLGWYFAALLYSLHAATRPLAAASFQIAGLCLWPAGKEIVRDRQIGRFHVYVRTGQVGYHATEDSELLEVRLLQAALWMPAGIVLTLGHALHGFLTAAPVLANPWETRSFSLLSAALFPSGVRVVAPNQVRAMRLTGASRRWPDYPRMPRRNTPLFMACRRLARPAATLCGAGLILWASSSANEAHLHSPVPVFMDRAGLGYGRGAEERGVSPAWRRPHAGPSLLVETAVFIPPAPVPAASGECASPTAPLVFAHLSRKQTGYGAQPLGSRQIPFHLVNGNAPPLRHLANIGRWDGSIGYAKSGKKLCDRVVAEKVARSTAYNAKVTTAARLARKAAPETVRVAAGGLLTHVGPAGGYAAEWRHVLKLQRWDPKVMYAKADEALGRSASAERVANAALLHVEGALAKRLASKVLQPPLPVSSSGKLVPAEPQV